MTREEPSVSGEGLLGISAWILPHIILLLRIVCTACKPSSWQTNTIAVALCCCQLYFNCNILIDNNSNHNKLWIIKLLIIYHQWSQPSVHSVHLTIWWICQSLSVFSTFPTFEGKLQDRVSSQSDYILLLIVIHDLISDKVEQNAAEQIYQTPAQFIIPQQTNKQYTHLTVPPRTAGKKPIKCLSADSTASEPSAVTSLMAPPIPPGCSVNIAKCSRLKTFLGSFPFSAKWNNSPLKLPEGLRLDRAGRAGSAAYCAARSSSENTLVKKKNCCVHVCVCSCACVYVCLSVFAAVIYFSIPACCHHGITGAFLFLCVAFEEKAAQLWEWWAAARAAGAAAAAVCLRRQCFLHEA